MASAILIAFWIISSVAIIVPGYIIIAQPKLPQFFLDLLLYGKVRGKRKDRTFLQNLEIPKRWFTHFYVVGVVANGYALYMTLQAYLNGQRPPDFHVATLNYVTSTKEVNTDAMSAIILIAMMFIQNVRRLMECLFVSLYSKGTMNWIHYMFGIALYSTFHLTVLCEAPDYTTFQVSQFYKETFQWRHIIGVSLFLWSSYHHHIVHEDFANLRKGAGGEVKTMEHKIPRGNWFELVSCPHYFMEVLIYISMIITSGPHHLTLCSVVFFVVTNQMVAASLSHKWYLDTFKDYPKDRKAIFPYLF